MMLHWSNNAHRKSEMGGSKSDVVNGRAYPCCLAPYHMMMVPQVLRPMHRSRRLPSVSASCTSLPFLPRTPHPLPHPHTPIPTPTPANETHMFCVKSTRICNSTRNGACQQAMKDWQWRSATRPHLGILEIAGAYRPTPHASTQEEAAEHHDVFGWQRQSTPQCTTHMELNCSARAHARTHARAHTCTHTHTCAHAHAPAHAHAQAHAH